MFNFRTDPENCVPLKSGGELRKESDQEIDMVSQTFLGIPFGRIGREMEHRNPGGAVVELQGETMIQ